MKSMYASRSVPVLNTPAPNAAYVDDSSSQNESLQRKADMANGAVQRVVQRETGVVQRVDNFPIDQFVYKDPQNGDLIFEKGHIVFTEYKSNLVSSNFTGCMMMAFKFKQSYMCKNFAGGTKRVFPAENYIAHVFCGDEGDTKSALFDAEQSNCIVIKSLFKPYQKKYGDKLIYKVKEYNDKHDKKIFLGMTGAAMTGRLYLDKKNCWCADVMAQNDIAYNYLGKKHFFLKDEKKKIRTLKSNELVDETLAAKAIIYASFLCNNGFAGATKDITLNRINQTVNPNDPIVVKAKYAMNKLNIILSYGQRYIQSAKENSENENVGKFLSLFLN